MKISREWATSLTIGSFLLIAVTGILMFFHKDSGLNKLAHEWLGWAVVIGVGLHAAVHWKQFKRYFASSRIGRMAIGVFGLLLAASFIPVGGEGGGHPHVLAMNAITSAPISTIAPLTGHTAEVLVARLQKAGVTVSGADVSISSVAKDRESQALAISVLFGQTTRN